MNHEEGEISRTEADILGEIKELGGRFDTTKEAVEGVMSEVKTDVRQIREDVGEVKVGVGEVKVEVHQLKEEQRRLWECYDDINGKVGENTANIKAHKAVTSGISREIGDLKDGHYNNGSGRKKKIVISGGLLAILGTIISHLSGAF